MVLHQRGFAGTRRHLAGWHPRLAMAVVTAVLAGCAVPDPSDTIDANYTAPAAARITRAIAYGPGPAQLMDLHYPSTQTAGVIVFIHAGGFCCGSRTGVGQFALKQISRGWVLASVDYALSSWPEGASAPTNPFPAAIRDIKRAIRYLKANAGPLGINSSRIVVWGESAGGSLAALAGTSAGALEPPGLPAALAAVDSRVHGVVDFVGPIDFATWLEVDHPWVPPLGTAYLGCGKFLDVSTCDPTIVAAASAHTHYTPDDPPMYVAYGELDTLVPYPQAIPLGLAYLTSNRRGFFWVDVVNGLGHNIQTGVNPAAVELFLDIIGSS